MDKSIKLSDKQKTSLEQVISQRQNLNAVMQDLNDKESLILGLILDMNGIQGTVKNVKLENGLLKFEVEEPKAPKKGGKVRELKQTEEVKA